MSSRGLAGVSNAHTAPGLARFPLERMSDAQLVQEVACGDRSAFGVIWDRYGKLVRGVVFGAIGPDSMNEDLVQEVFFGFFRGAANIQDGAALRGFLVGVAVRTAASELRRRKVRRWVGLSATGELPELPVLAEDSEGRQTLRALYRVLDQLSSRRRMVFVLRHVQGLELLEIVAALEISESTVRRELGKAQQQLAALAKREPALAEYLKLRDESRGSS
jgi:RNA polymerase sigma-70 factor (ECF subfamily)